MHTESSQSVRFTGVLAVVVVLALGLPLAIWMAGGPRGASVRSADARSTPEAVGDGVGLREPARVASPAPALPAAGRASAEAPDDEAPQEAEPPAPGGVGFLTVLVRSRETAEPLAGVRLLAVLDDLEDGRVFVHGEAHRGCEEDVLVTDELGIAVFALPAGRAARLDVRDERYAPRHSQRAIAPFATAEKRDVIVELTTEPDLAFHGRLVSGAGGGPIGGAEIDVRQAGQGLFRVTSEADGTFALRTNAWRHAYLRVEADGYGPALVPVTGGHGSPEQRREIVLEAAAAIVFTVVDAHNTVRDDVALEVTARPRGLARGPGDLAYADAERFSWSSRDTWWSRGRNRIPGLPPGAPLALELVGPGSQREAQTVVLAPGEVRRLQLFLRPPVELSGKLLDRKGSPVPGKEVWLVPSGGAGARYLDCGDGGRRELATTNADGSFRFLGVYEGDYLVGPSPACPPSRDFPGSSNDERLATLGFPVEVRSGAENEIVLRVDRELAIRGRVVDGDGEGVGRASVEAVPVDDDGTFASSTNADGAFVVGPLQSGRFALRARAEIGGEPCVSLQRTVPAGADEVELRVDPIRGRIRGFVLDAVSGEPRGDLPVVALAGAPRFQSWDELRHLEADAAGAEWRGALMPEVLDELRALGYRVRTESHTVAGMDVSHRLNGEFLLSGLEPGTYTLALGNEHAFGTKVVTLPSKNGEVLRVVVPAWVSGRLTVEAPERHPWTVRVWGHGLFLGRWNLRGREQEMLAVPGGHLTVELSDGNGPGRVETVVLPSGGAARVAFSD